MFQVGRVGTPPDAVPAFQQDIRRIERIEKGTTLNDAVVLEREKQQRREKQPDAEPQPKRHEQEPVHVYTAGATETELENEESGLNIVA